jgi:alcohol dehydrogenase
VRWLPTPEVLSGANALSELSPWLVSQKVSRLAIVSDHGLALAGVIDRVLVLIPETITVAVFDQVLPDPGIALVESAIAFAKDANVDAILGIGGGSSIDTAKLVAALSTGRQEITSVMEGDQISSVPLPLMIIPTTAGTGSEVTPIAVISDQGDELKKAVVSVRLIPQMVILDPLLTLSLPRAQTAYTGMDALIHAIESFLSVHSNEFTQALSLRALKLIWSSLPAAYENGNDIESREALLLGSCLAGMAFANAGVAAIHAFAYPLGGRYHLPHGLANALMLMPLMRFNLKGDGVEMKFQRMNEAVGGTAEGGAFEFLDALQRLLRVLDFPLNLASVGVRRESLPIMARSVMSIDRLLRNNPRKVMPDRALMLYEEAYCGADDADRSA